MGGLGKGVVQELNNDIKYTGKVVQGHVCYQLIGFFQTLIYISVCVRVCIYYPFSTLFSSPWFGVFYTILLCLLEAIRALKYRKWERNETIIIKSVF